MKNLPVITKTFKSGNSQAVRIPSDMQLPYGEVEITVHGDGLLVRPIKKQTAAVLLDVIAGIGESDIERPDFTFQKRSSELE